MISRVRWQIWVLCASLAVCCVLALLTRYPSHQGLDKHGERALNQPEQGNQRETPPPGHDKPARNSAPAFFQRSVGRAANGTLQKLLSSSPSESFRASALVANMDGSQLAEALKGTNATLKVASALEVARRSAPGLVSELLRETSMSSDGKTRTAMLSAIASIKSDDCLKELANPLGLKKDEDIQEAAKAALLRSGSPVVVDTLIAYAGTNATNEYLCREVGRTLASIRNKDSIPNLLGGIDSQSQSVAAGCVFALAAIGEPRALETLFGQLGTAKGFQNSLLIDAIARVRSPAGLPVLSSQLLSTGGNGRLSARRAALTALGNYSLEQRSPVLNQFLAVESDSQLRTEATRLLTR